MSSRFIAYVYAPRVLAELAREEWERGGTMVPDPGRAPEYLRLACSGWRVRFVAQEGALLLPLGPEWVELAEQLARHELSGHERVRCQALREATRDLAEGLLADYPDGVGF